MLGELCVLTDLRRGSRQQAADKKSSNHGRCFTPATVHRKSYRTHIHISIPVNGHGRRMGHDA